MKQVTWKDFEEHCKMIQQATPVEVGETIDAKQKRIERAKKDYKFFFKYYFPMYAKAPCAWFHILFANALLKNKLFKGIARWFRGSAKSTHATLGWPLWLKINEELKTMLLVGQTEKKAFRLLADIQAQLTNNRRFINDFGEQFSFGSWSEGEFITKDNCAFYAIGLGQNPRGTRNEANRPDYIVVDDADSKKLSKNPKLVREAADWIMEDLMGCFDIGSERFILVNNLISKTSIMATVSDEKLKGGDRSVKSGCIYTTKGNWHLLTVNALDKKGFPTWPEKYTIQYWKQKRSETSMRAWEKEYMNNPLLEGTIFKPEWIKWRAIRKLREYDDLVVYCDPSFKNTATSDFKAIKFWGKKGSELHLIRAFCRQCSVSTMVKWFYDLHESLPEDIQVDYYIEANMLQDLLLDEFYEEGESRNYQLPIRPDHRSKPDKFGRIEATSPLYERGFIIYNQEEKDDPDMVAGIDQLLATEQGNSAPDDGPDADEGAIWLLQRRGRSKSRSNETRTGKRQRENDY
jgi:hypothetical protein